MCRRGKVYPIEVGCSFLLAQKGTKDAPGTGSEERQRSSRLPPDPVTGDASPRPFRGPGAGGTADCLRFCAAAAGRAISRTQSGWTRKARRLPPAVGAGPDTESQSAWHQPGGPGRRRNFSFAGVFLFVCPKRNQKCPGSWLRGAPALQSPASGLRYGGRLPKAVPRTRRGWYSRLSLLPRRCRWLDNSKKAFRLDEESAPVATSRRGGRYCGRMVSAPTPSLGSQSAEILHTQIKNAGATGMATPTDDFLVEAEAKRSFAESFFAYFFLRKK